MGSSHATFDEPVRLRRQLFAAVIAVGIAALIGVAVWWPTGEAPGLYSEDGTPELVDATMTEAGKRDCPGLGYDDVLMPRQQITARVTSGPNIGDPAESSIYITEQSVLPLLLFFAQGGTPFSRMATSQIVSVEIVSVEIVLTVIGSIGLVLSVPLTTALAAAVLVPVEHEHEHEHGTEVDPAREDPPLGPAGKTSPLATPVATTDVSDDGDRSRFAPSVRARDRRRSRHRHLIDDS